MKITIKESEQRSNQKIDNNGNEISDLLFQVKNNISEFKFVKEQAKKSMEQFIEMQNSNIKSKQEIVDMFEKQNKRSMEDIDKFNKRQTDLEQILDRRLAQLDSLHVRVTQEEALSDEFKKEIKEITDFLFDLQNNKVNIKTFEERSIDQYSELRKFRIQIESVTTQMKTLENY
jgi:hypothetical protein